jgi:ankyrin repeat protein
MKIKEKTSFIIFIRITITINHLSLTMATATILFNAAKNGDLATVKALRESSGVDVIGSRQDDGMSSILLACKNGHIDLLNHLLEQGANPNDEKITVAHV